MPNDSVLLNTGTGGERLRTRSSTVGADEVHEQGIYMPGIDTYYAYADNVAFANGKNHLTIFNASGSGKVVTCRKLFATNLQTATVTGIIQRFNIQKCTATSGGTSITPVKSDSLISNLPAQITVATNVSTASLGTVTTLFPWITTTEENTTSQPVTQAVFQQATNILLEGGTIQEYNLNPGEGLNVSQNVNSTAGTYGWLLVFTVI